MNKEALKLLTSELTRAECQLALAQWELSHWPTQVVEDECLFYFDEIAAITRCIEFLSTDPRQVSGGLPQCAITALN